MLYRRMNGISNLGFNFNTIANNIVLWKGIQENDHRVLEL